MLPLSVGEELHGRDRPLGSENSEERTSQRSSGELRICSGGGGYGRTGLKARASSAPAASIMYLLSDARISYRFRNVSRGTMEYGAT